ncbi:unnamed protein product, partial [Candidula unifasciata]
NVLDSDAEDEIGPALAKKFNSLKRKKKLAGKQLETKVKVSGGKEVEELVILKKQKLIKSAGDSVLQKDKTDSPVIMPPAASSNAVIINTVAVTAVTTTVTAPSRTITASVTGGGDDAGSEMLREDQLKSIEDIFNIVLNENINEDSCSKSGEEGKGENQLVERNTQLPAQLPPYLLEAIENMKREAKESKEKKFFSAYINKLLLDIELGSHRLPWGSKTAIYNHLSEHLPCGKYTLQRRAKKLRESQEEDQLKGPIRTLKEAIMKVMPALQEQHEMDVQKAKVEAEAKEDPADVAKEEVSTESEGEEKADTKKKPRGPRRKFFWNSEIRTLLLGIIATKVKHYSTFKSRSQTAEEYLRAYLDSEIKPLWPAGWMQTRTLFKESRKAHEEFTKGGQQQGKQRKAITSLDSAPTNAEITHSQMLKKAAVDLATIKTETTNLQISKSEGVIEVSSILNGGRNKKDTVVINLPNSMGSLPQTFHSSILYSSVSDAGNLTTNSAKAYITLPHTVGISASSTSWGMQSPCLTSTTSSVKVVASAAFAETAKVSPAAGNELESMNPAFSYGSSDSKMAASAASTSSIISSYSEGLGDLNNNGSAKLTPLPPPPQSEQPARIIYKQLNSQQQKMSALGQKFSPDMPTSKISQPTQSSGVPTTAESLQQKADSRLSHHGTVKNSNSSWTTVTSVVPSGQSLNPVSVNLVTNTSALKHSVSLVSVQENQMLLSQSQQQKLLQSAKSSLNVVKKQNLLGSGLSSSSMVSLAPGSETFNKPSILPVKAAGTVFKEDSINSKLVQYLSEQKKSGQPNQQLKSGVVIATSSSAPVLNPHHQHLKTGIVIGTGTLPLFKPHTAADFAGWTSSKSKNIKQPVPFGKTTLSAQTFTSTARPSPAPSLSNKSDLFNNSSSMPLSRTDTPSPQMSPVSPAEVTALSLYEQIKTQVQNQEAIEGQALKNLAMARKLVGASEADIFGQDGGAKSSQEA